MPLAPALNPARTKDSAASPWFYNPWIVFAVAFALRLALIFGFKLYSLAISPHHHFQFGWEMGRIARAIASGRGYADPFYGHTGPTAWVAPLYPYLMAGVFRLLGIYTLASAVTLMTLNALLEALIVFPMRSIASRCFNRKIAVASIWVWAVWPFTMRNVAHMRDTSLTALLFTCVIALTICMRGIKSTSERSTNYSNPTLRQWLTLGLLWGVIALADPALLLFLPACFLWILSGSWTQKNSARFRQEFLRAVWAVLLCIGIMAPWMTRNVLVFHKFIPLRSDFGAELYLGNGPGSNGQLMIWKHPYDSPQQYELYRSMGEIAYCQMRGEAGTAFIREHPAHFMADTLRRIYYFWLGLPQPSNPNPIMEYASAADFMFFGLCGLLGLLLAFRNRVPGIPLFAWAFLLCPLTYYFVVVEPRFRYSLDPLLYIFIIYLWTTAEESNRVRWFTPSWWRARFTSQA